MLMWCHCNFLAGLTHWGRVTHICIVKLTIFGSDNGLSVDRRQAIIWTNAGLLLIGPLGTNFSEILIKILIFSFKKMRLKVSAAKRRPFCLGLNVLTWALCWSVLETYVIDDTESELQLSQSVMTCAKCVVIHKMYRSIARNTGNKING